MYDRYMYFQQSGSRYVVRIVRGEEVMSTLTQFLNDQSIKAASVSGIGAASRVKLRYYDEDLKDYQSKEFKGRLEIASLLGNISLLEGKIWPHLHIVLADTKYQCFGGHLEEAVISATCEIVLDPIQGELTRAPDEETGLHLLDL